LTWDGKNVELKSIVHVGEKKFGLNKFFFLSEKKNNGMIAEPKEAYQLPSPFPWPWIGQIGILKILIR
jgi:hypothetical protein